MCLIFGIKGKQGVGGVAGGLGVKGCLDGLELGFGVGDEDAIFLLVDGVEQKVVLSGGADGDNVLEVDEDGAVVQTDERHVEARQRMGK
jgi:hypothetical protein